MMQVVLLERVENLGQMGDIVRVRPGYARNYLLPQRKALRASEQNLRYFEAQRTQLEALNLRRRQEAEAASNRLAGTRVTVIRRAGETGQLYGSVSSRDVVEALDDEGVKVERRQISMPAPIKTLGLHEVRIVLHPEVSVGITVNVARSNDEAEAQARGEDVSVERSDYEFESGLEELLEGSAEDVEDEEAQT